MLEDICADEKGMANGVVVDVFAKLDGDNSIVGRSIVVHNKKFFKIIRHIFLYQKEKLFIEEESFLFLVYLYQLHGKFRFSETK